MKRSYRTPMLRARRGVVERPIIAWDLETTPIPSAFGDEVRITPLYFTAYDGERLWSRPLRGFDDLRIRLLEVFDAAPARARFVAWNGNRFDNRLALLALRDEETVLIEPYLTRQLSLRGARVTIGEKIVELCDGIAMLGQSCSLAEFVQRYAPELPKGSIDWEKERFDASDPTHRAYAERDSIALYHAMTRAIAQVQEFSGLAIGPTIGNLGIRYLESILPEGVKIWPVPERVGEWLTRSGMRGGLVLSPRPYRGPIWQYDLNQAYAGVLRSGWYPCGGGVWTRTFVAGAPGFYVGTLSRATHAPIPYYVRDLETTKGVETVGAPVRCVLASCEVSMLRRFGWSFAIEQGYVWEEQFRLTEAVRHLERARRDAPGGPKGALGSVIKAIGCNMYGKTVERTEDRRIVFRGMCPEGFASLDGGVLSESLWVAPSEDSRKHYHRPQIGATITAQVRCITYRAAMQRPKAFVKADTDSVAFSEPVALPESSWRYGRWKTEYAGVEAIVKGKKLYALANGTVRAKGLDRRELSFETFARWWDEGIVPSTISVQLLRIGKDSPESMYHILKRRAQRE